jgi:hypothetical protein
MSQPITLPGNPSGKARRANWLGRYLEVEKRFDKELKAALLDATKGIDEALVELTGKKTISARTRRLQLSLAHKEIRNQMNYLFGDVGNLVRSHRAKAAVAAVDAALLDESKLLARMFKDPIKRKAYADSLRATAERNIEAVVTRVLHTQQPLSRRVYKTRALANGLVSSAINRGLARGDSADDIARAVHNLIDPNTPGGVSYAAIRLGRTEINNAFHAQAILDAQQKPWITHMRWNLSKVHQEQGCVCEDYAAVGLFSLEHVPPKPHPNCRCYVTPEAEDYEDFENSLVQGHYDSYLEDILDASEGKQPAVTTSALKPLKMEPAPAEPKTTKASQPEGWTGPPVAKAAANAQVRQIEDDFWVKYMEQKKFLNEAREGSRKMQINGYRGGLSAQGKKNLLAQEQDLIADKKIALDIGREMTARLAYAEPSTEKVYRAVKLSVADIDNIKARSGVSMPLSSFHTKDVQALKYIDENEFGSEIVIFEVAEGAKVSQVGTSLRVTMGEFEIDSMDYKTLPTGEGRFLTVRLKQRDIREFDAEAPVSRIPEVEFFDAVEEFAKKGGVSKPTGGVTAGPAKPVATPKTAERAKTVPPELVWRGPRIVNPTEPFRAEVDDIWVRSYWGETGAIIRDGAQTALQKGYSGSTLLNLQKYAKQIPEDAGEYISDEARLALHAVGQEMTARVVHAPLSTRPLYRGVSYSDETLRSLREGSNMNLPLSSFGTRETAETYAFTGDMSYLPKSMRPYDGDNPVIFKLQEGAKAEFISTPGDAEWVSFGEFKIVSVKKLHDADLGDYTEIEIKHIGLQAKKPPLKEAIEKSTDVLEIKDLMKQKHNLVFTGFDPSDVTLPSARETMIALDEMLDKYPHAAQSLTHVEVWPAKKMNNAYAHVQPEWDGTSKMRLNKTYMLDYAGMKDRKEYAEGIKWSVSSSGEAPWRSTTIHEFGHVMDWAATRMNMEYELAQVIGEVYAKEDPGYMGLTEIGKKRKLKKWLQGTTSEQHDVYNGAGPSRYGVWKPGAWGFNKYEVVAEAFLDVERNGDKATPVSKAVHKLLIDKLKEREANPV